MATTAAPRPHRDPQGPRRPNVPSAHVRLPAVRDYEQVDREIIATLHPTVAWFIGLGVAVFFLATGIAAWMYQIYTGLGVAGYNPPVMWGVYIITFVFWIGIGHAGTLISAILYLFRAGFRTTIYRCSEAMTVFAVMTAGLFPILHLGRPWKFFWLIPYPNWRYLWPQFKSPLIWDVFAILTYFTVSSTFLYIGLIPDIAVLRDRENISPIRKRIYSILALGWRNTDREWRHFARAYLFLAAFSTPLVLSVHSVVSFDFAMALTPGWHTTIFPPYFVAGAIYAGFAMVLLLTIPLRRFYGLEGFITMRHMHNMGKVMLATGLIVGYGYIMEAFFGWYSGNRYERFMIWNRMHGPYSYYYWALILCNIIAPQFLWFKRFRSNLLVLWIISLVVSIGMWLERFVIVVTSLHRDYLPSSWGMYYPTIWDWMTFIGTIGLFVTLFFLFVRFLPMISIFEMRTMAPEAKVTESEGH
jgi:Ni/Fe-hydrogenase subunit HybB-like protein